VPNLVALGATFNEVPDKTLVAYRLCYIRSDTIKTIA